MITTIVILSIVWFAIGACGFIFWWTKDSDLTTKHISMVLLTSTYGPLSWWIEYCIHGKEKKEPKVLLKKRNDNRF